MNMENKEVICAALAEPKQSKAHSLTQKILTGAAAFSAAVGTAVTPVFAQFEAVDFNVDAAPDAPTLMGNVLGILLGISKYVGIALLIYGVYEVVMSYMQNQPEAKTKGIVMALAGAVMMSLQNLIDTILVGG